jgi:hypothetical protein
LLPGFLRQELLAIAQSMERATPYLRLQVTTVAPAKYQEGDVYEAASPWNPGSGDGCYIRRGAAWVKLG